MTKKSRLCRRLASSLAVGALAATGIGLAPSAAVGDTALTVSVDPSYQGPEFRGWGTSLVWFANATGDYPQELRQRLFDAVFGPEGLNLNIARYNIGGGNSLDTPDYMRAGAAVEGWWAPELPVADWSPIRAEYDNKAAYAEQWDGDDPASYNFDADLTQRWWVEQAATARDDMVWEAFSNSPPWFMTPNGYVSGPFTAGSDQLQPESVEDFADYLVTVVEHLENEYDIEFNSLDPFNQPNAPYPRTRLDENGQPSGRQEGAPMSVPLQEQVIAAVEQRISESDTSLRLSATDESGIARLLTSWNAFSDTTRDAIDQLNVHLYNTEGRPALRDIAKTNAKPAWQSEVDGSYGEGYSLTDMENGLGIAQQIVGDMRELEPEAWTLWQAVEDKYNMDVTSDQSWGSILVDLDCNADGQSARRVADGVTDAGCEMVTNAKFNTVRNFTHFIRPGANFVPTSDANTTAAITADDTGVTVVHVNDSDEARTVTLDLAKFATIADGGSVTPIITTESSEENTQSNALVEGAAVPIDPASKTATLTVPAKSVTTFVVSGATGVAADAHPLGEGGQFSLQSLDGSLSLTATAEGAVLTPVGDEPTESQQWTVHRLTAGNTNNERFVLMNFEGDVLAAEGESVTTVDTSLDAASANPALQWILTTTDGVSHELVSANPDNPVALTAATAEEGATARAAVSTGAAEQNWLFTSLDGDTTAPAVAISSEPAAPNGENGWFVSDVSITATATDDADASPIVEVRIDGGEWEVVEGAVVISADGEHSVSARATDASGNVSEITSSTITIDKTAPTATHAVSDGAVLLKASDATSGVAAIQYAKTPPGGDVTEWATYTEPIVAGDAAISIAYRAVDEAGNVSELGEVTLVAGGDGEDPGQDGDGGSTGVDRPDGHLAATGAAVGIAPIVAALLLAAGTALFLIRRRRKIVGETD